VIPKLLLATNNRGKVKEIIPLLEGIVDVVICLGDMENRVEVEETEDTFEGNAVLKAETLFRSTGIITLADDSGLEVDALNGSPGVYSARFAGENAADGDNNKKLLDLMTGIPVEKRLARFRCVMALAGAEGTFTFDGTVEGSIADKPSGSHGFGYDPLFIPNGYSETFANLGLGVKKSISHRTRALRKVVEFLSK
jgi:XTP/dITP diphosphohydrolase